MEATLSGPTSPVVLAVGAAVVTGVIVVGVIAGPGTVACFQRDDFGQCMNETFLGGQPVATAESEEAVEDEDVALDEGIEDIDELEAEESEPEAEPESIAVAEDTGAESESVAAAQDTEAEPEPVIIEPTFELIRVEPDGSAVIAGIASPEGEVHIFVDEDMIGAEATELSGDWVFVTEDPLPTGGVEVRVLDTVSDTYADSSVIVVVQDDRTGEPLVIAAAPGEASEILQGLEPMQVAEADPVEEPETTEPAPEPVEEIETAEPAQEPAIATVEEAVEETVEQETFEIAQAQEIETPETDITGSEVSTDLEPLAVEPEDPEVPAVEDDAVSEPEAPEAVEDEPVSAEPATDPQPASEDQAADDEAAPVARDDEATIPADAADEAEPAAPAESTEMASVPAVDEPVAEPEVVIVPPSIDAVEIDGDRNFFAGGGTDGYPVRLYVDNEPVATTTVDGGRWLIETIGRLRSATQRVRVDMLNPDGTVAGRAEVDFVLDIPEEDPAEREEERIVVAEDPDPVELPEPIEQEQRAVSEAVEPESPEIEAETREQPVVDAPTEEPAPEPPMTDESAAGDEPAPPATEEPEVELPSEPIGEEPVVDEPVTRDDAAEEAPVDEAAAEDIATETPAVEVPVTEEPLSDEPVTEEPAAEEPIVEPDVPTMVGVVDGDLVVSGRAIIRRGDNLWTISRRVYGEGIRYTQIYEANIDQIRDPDLIYPGQVFELPETDMVIGEDEDA